MKWDIRKFVKFLGRFWVRLRHKLRFRLRFRAAKPLKHKSRDNFWASDLLRTGSLSVQRRRGEQG